MGSETRICQSCKQNFVIEPDDFSYYEKIQVPPPTWCPDCRLQRRLIWRNERTLFKRKCNAPGHSEDLISTYSPEIQIPVYDHDYWYSDAWDANDYGRDYDFNRPFFDQYKELLFQAPHLPLFDSKSTNSSFCNITVELKNCYLVTAGWGNEDSIHCNRISYCKDTVDSYVCHKTEFGYENVYCEDSYKLLFSLRAENCRESYFLYDCRNCSNCVCCTNLRNKQYYIFNQPYSKDEYFKKLEKLNLENRDGIQKIRERFNELKLKAIHRYAKLTNTERVIGDNIEKSKNLYYCFDIPGEAENSKYCHWATKGLKDSYDTGPGTGGNSELTYEGISIGVTNSNCKFGAIIWYSRDVQYSFNCQDSHDLFGCANLRKKQYCILNKQYTKEEYNKLIPKIIEHMNNMPYVDKKGRVYKYGEFFPAETSPYAYNETVAQDYVPLEKKTCIDNGFNWRDREQKQYQISLPAEKIPFAIDSVSEEIINENLGCSHNGNCNDQCTRAFRVTKQEFEFYKRMKLPIPNLCPNCRHYQRVKQRNPLKLWHRSCMCDYQVFPNTTKHSHHLKVKCPNEFETSYSPDRKEIIYCEQCYNAEVA